MYYLFSNIQHPPFWPWQGKESCSRENTQEMSYDVSWALSKFFFFFFHFLYYLLIFLDNTLVLRHPPPIDNDNSKGRLENERYDEENTQKTLYNVSWACGMFFFLLFLFISILLTFFSRYSTLIFWQPPPPTTTTTNSHLNASHLNTSKLPSRRGNKDSEGNNNDEDKGLETHMHLKLQVCFFKYIYALLNITTRLRWQCWRQHNHHHQTTTQRLQHMKRAQTTTVSYHRLSPRLPRNGNGTRREWGGELKTRGTNNETEFHHLCPR